MGGVHTGAILKPEAVSRLGSPRGKDAALALAAGSAFVLLEALIHLAVPVVLDPQIELLEVLGNAALLGTMMAVLCLLMSPLARSWALFLSVFAWALVWAPEGPRGQDASPWLALIPLMLLLGIGWQKRGLAVVLGVLGAGWVPALRDRGRGSPPVETSAAARDSPSILLISIDTLRADQAGWRQPGPHGVPLVSPEEWAIFPQTIAAAPWTLPAMHSLFSGLAVHAHGGGQPIEGRYSQRHPSLSSWVQPLQQAGYATTALVCNPHLRRDNHFDVGFERWHHADRARHPLVLAHNLDALGARLQGRLSSLGRSRDARLVDVALQQLAEPGDRPRLIWLHLLDPHEYHRDPEVLPGGQQASPTEIRQLEEAYGFLIARTRARLEQLAAASPGWILVLTSDHGEAFGEDGRWGHGQALHDAELHVPLAMRGPGVTPGVYPQLAAASDLGRTLLALSLGSQTDFPGLDLFSSERATIRVGGLRRHADRFAERDASGSYQPMAIASQPGQPEEPQDHIRDALRALGYTD